MTDEQGIDAFRTVTTAAFPDLASRIVAAYEALTGRVPDRRRVALLTGVHRLSELATLADDPAHVATMVRNVADWAETW